MSAIIGRPRASSARTRAGVPASGRAVQPRPRAAATRASVRIPGPPTSRSAANTPVLAIAEGRALLALVSETQPADPEDAQTTRLIQAIDEQVGSALAQDVFGYFARALQAEAGITFNQAAINAVHASFP